jgi:outer membrane protein OmpA-like peptidoglycan-associated protein
MILHTLLIAKPILAIFLKVEGTVYDKLTGVIIPNATVVVCDEAGKELRRIQADALGKYAFDSECSLSYVLKNHEKGFLPTEIKVVFNKKVTNQSFDIYIEKPIVKEIVKEVPKEIVVGTDLGKVFHLEIIRFDVSKWNIRKDAAVQLNKIVAVMKEYPNLIIEIGSHTDARDTAKNNMVLSGKRAKSTMNYIISKGVAKTRLTCKGYGESKLLNKCADGVKCTPFEHLQNRRSEFIIVKM